ncbi:uncharacterized protein C1orf141 homolog [Ambystoma mexicanum]|uniref:uncharacterized protein C1orf141 homolog n=1 Tax=Ambystoma mexicanum TaxID=8296 RepID=UPI0037E890BF
MTQRLLAEFDILDKYSQTVLNKHAEEKYLGNIQLRNNLNTPLTYDFDLDSNQPSISRTQLSKTKSLFETVHYGQNVSTMDTRSLCGPLTPRTASPRDILSYKPVIRPFSAPQLLEVKDSDPQEVVSGVKRRLRIQPKSATYRTQCPRRPSWKTKVEDIPTLDDLCQREIKLPVGSCLDYTDFSHWSSSTTIPVRNENVSLAGGNPELHKMYIEIGKLIANQLQKGHTSVSKHANAKLRETESRRFALVNDDISDNKAKECLKRNVELSDKVSEDKKDKKEIVSLSIEDEMKKPNVKVFNIGPQGERASNTKSSETYPILYKNQGHRFITYQPMSSGDYSGIGRSNFQPKLKNKSGKSGMNMRSNPILQNNLKWATKVSENNTKLVSTSAPVKREMSKRLWSAKHKINIHILAADGTSEVVHFRRDNHDSTHKSRHSFLENEMPVNKFSTTPMRLLRLMHESVGVGPVVNGRNPDAEIGHVSSSTTRSAITFSPHASVGRPTTSSHSQKSSDVDQTVKWNYISITKPLKTPECETYTFTKNTSACNKEPNLANALSDHKSTQFFPDSLEHTNLTGVSAMKGLCIGNSQKHNTLESIHSVVPCQQTMPTENISGDKKMENDQLLSEAVQEQEPLQISSIRKSSMIPTSMKDPVTEPDVSHRDAEPAETESLVNQTEDKIPLLTLEPEPVYCSALPIINIPTAQTEEPEFETARTM